MRISEVFPKDYCRLLDSLYQNQPAFVEEIFILENLHLSLSVKAYADSNFDNFLLLQQNPDHTIWAFLKGDKKNVFTEKILPILSLLKKFSLQTDPGREDFFRKFKEPSAIRETMILDRWRPTADCDVPQITVEMIDPSQTEGLECLTGGFTERFRQMARYGILCGVKADGRWASTGGALVHSADCEYLFFNTDEQYRGRGLAKAIGIKVLDMVKSIKRKPLYGVEMSNSASLKLARSLGFEGGIKRTCFEYESFKIKGR